MLKFGTDGIRGRAYDEVTIADVEALAYTAGRVLGGDAMVIGTDTRESGPDFVAAVCRGIARGLVDIDGEMREPLKRAGFLTRDPRKKESKKYGLKKARKAPQYSKR